MTTEIPDDFTDLLTNKKAFAMVATINPDGSPQLTPVWIDYDGQHVLFNTARGRVKDRNLSDNRHVAVTVLDPDNPYRYLQVQGMAQMTEEGAEAHIDKLAKKYLGKDTYPYRQPGEERVKVLVTPEHVDTRE